MNSEELATWTKNRTETELSVETVDNNADKLVDVIRDRLPHLIALPIGEEQNLDLWRDYVGATNSNIFYDYDNAIAYVLFNVNSIAVADMVDASVGIIRLLSTGAFTQKSLSEELGVNEMAISRIKARRNKPYDARLDLNLRVNALLARVNKRY
jgi:hypothetical protein